MSRHPDRMALFFSKCPIQGGAVNGIGRGGAKSGRGSAWTDNFVVDGLVRLTGAICQAGGTIVSTLQSGRVRLYLSLSVGVVALALVLRWVL